MSHGFPMGHRLLKRHGFLTAAARTAMIALTVATGVLATTACGSAPSAPAAGVAAGPTGAVPSAAGQVTAQTAAVVGSGDVSAAAGVRVDGIPAFLAVPPGASVTGSAVGHKGTLLQVSITGSTGAKVADVLAFYRKTLTKAGFTATDDGVLPTGSSGTAYGRGDTGELLVVAVVDNGSARSFSVGGTVAAG